MHRPGGLRLLIWAMALSIAAPLQAQLQVLSDEGMHAGQLDVPVNKSQVLRTDRPFARALIGNEAIADVLPLTNRSLYVLGKEPGTTSLTLYDRYNNLIAVVDLVVGPDILGLRRELAELVPGEEVGARVSNDSVVLTGVVSSAPAVHRAVQIAESYAPERVINMMSVGSTQQVMLEVRFAEMRRSAARQLGFNSALIDNDGDFIAGIGTNSPSTALLTDQAGNPVVDIGGILDSFGIVGAGFNIGDLDIFSVLDALERNGVVSTLAEPTLIALSGETASFLAGGEFPIPVLQSGGGQGGGDGATGITIEFKPFGVSLAFTPTVLADGIISLVVAPEVSSIDTAASITVNDLTIPGLQVRRARTTLELRDGQSFAMAGLLRQDFRETVRRFPILGSIPIIGSLFRSTEYQRENTELVIIVTPRLVRPFRSDLARVPTDHYRPPNRADQYLLGGSESATEHVPFGPLASPPAPADLEEGGVEGEHGHIVE